MWFVSGSCDPFLPFLYTVAYNFCWINPTVARLQWWKDSYLATLQKCWKGHRCWRPMRWNITMAWCINGSWVAEGEGAGRFIARWWLKILFLFTPIWGRYMFLCWFIRQNWGKDPNWRAYFWDGLVQPPTSKVVKIEMWVDFCFWLLDYWWCLRNTEHPPQARIYTYTFVGVTFTLS